MLCFWQTEGKTLPQQEDHDSLYRGGLQTQALQGFPLRTNEKGIL